MRYLPTTGSPFISPANTERTYVKTRSIMAMTLSNDRLRISKSEAGVVVWESVDNALVKRLTGYTKYNWTVRIGKNEVK